MFKNKKTITILFQHEFITQAKPCTILHKMIQEAKEIHEAQSQANQNEDDSVSALFFNFSGVVVERNIPTFLKV